MTTTGRALTTRRLSSDEGKLFRQAGADPDACVFEDETEPPTAATPGAADATVSELAELRSLTKQRASKILRSLGAPLRRTRDGYVVPAQWVADNAKAFWSAQ